MPNAKIKLSIPFKSLTESITGLSLVDKLRLWQLLEQQIAQADEDVLEQDPKVLGEIQEAREAVLAKDYLTIDEYIATRKFTGCRVWRRGGGNWKN
jgi:hypothetical protein